MLNKEIYDQIILEQELDALDIQEKDYHRMDTIMNTICDHWDDIEDKIAKKYPYVYENNFDFHDMVTTLLNSLPRVNKEASYDISYDFLENIAVATSEFILHTCDAYNNYYERIEKEKNE